MKETFRFNLKAFLNEVCYLFRIQTKFHFKKFHYSKLNSTLRKYYTYEIQ